MIVLLKKLLESVESLQQTQKTSTESSNPENQTQAQIERVGKNLSPEQQYLGLLRERIDSQDRLIHEIGGQVKMLAENLSSQLKVQNEIAKQVMILTDAIAQFQDAFSGPEYDYRFFSTDDPYN